MKSPMNAIGTLVAVVLLTACGGSGGNNAATLKEADVAIPTYTCTNLYFDSSLQESPLFTEEYDYATNGEQIMHKYGVSPGDSDYFAIVGQNLNDSDDNSIALSIFDSESQGSSIGIFPAGTDQLMVLRTTSPTSTLMVSCKLQAL